ncbi:SNF7 family protein (macronuclear) [Tetrahymena thermophila SB210]|uniref:SNF7 family protein n=1 Tax=Tetrahymena thermophila (strain SB210) TaxID=312017 RepID=Q22M35_TETTS|nr:SNF7 family protein [Tetrahymena thermophila SB210]EAR86556.1 SNF7 family protein [Tetrahymena thermophila SB210]|eukprot:XP_977185.1 SNF7 family protein [Tetrahymena thermophila SB210]
MGSFFSHILNNNNTHQKDASKSKIQTIQDKQIKAASTYQMSEKDKIILDLKKVQDQLNRRIKQMENNANDCQAKAKEHLLNKNKIRAKYALQAKAIYEKQIEGILNQDVHITKTIRQVQEKFDQLDVSNTLQAANKLMKDIDKAIDVDGMQDAIGNLQELEANNSRFDELYNQYVSTDKQEIEIKLKEMEVEIFESDLKQYEIITQKPLFQEEAIQQQQQQPISQQKQQAQDQYQQQEQKQNDEIDDQLAMLA